MCKMNPTLIPLPVRLLPPLRILLLVPAQLGGVRNKEMQKHGRRPERGVAEDGVEVRAQREAVLFAGETDVLDRLLRREGGDGFLAVVGLA